MRPELSLVGDGETGKLGGVGGRGKLTAASAASNSNAQAPLHVHLETP
jgi:hypothetical protein